MKLKIEFDCDNAAFEDDLPNEVKIVLITVAHMIQIGETKSRLCDSNGNTIGRFILK